jgi:hypothetical protein
MLQINQKVGFDCAGCAWPDPDGKRSAFDFCENGAKAIAHESDRRRVTPEFSPRIPSPSSRNNRTIGRSNRTGLPNR